MLVAISSGATLENSPAVPKKLNVELPYDLISLLGRCSREMKICPAKNLYMNVHYSIIHSSQKVETSQNPIS